MNLRIGQGYDVHRLTEGRDLILGGVKIPYTKGLSGHSDADVLVHAIIDALLGAAGLDDIGTHFPDTDPAWKNADSCELLTKVIVMIRENGWELVNIDSTVILQKPRIRDHIKLIRENLSRYTGLSIEAISVKAKTEEGLGFTGSEEGVKCLAVALLKR